MDYQKAEKALNYFEGLGMAAIAYCQDQHDEWLEGVSSNGSWNRSYDKDMINAIGYLFETMNEPYSIDDLRHNLTLEKQKDELMQDYGPTL